MLLRKVSTCLQKALLLGNIGHIKTGFLAYALLVITCLTELMFQMYEKAVGAHFDVIPSTSLSAD